MTVGTLRARASVARFERADLIAGALLAAGCLALAARSLAPAAIVATASVGALGWVMTPRAGRHVSAARWLAVTGAGCAVFALTTTFGSAPLPARTAISVLAVSVAAVAEEAFFRGAMQPRLERWGAVVAVAVPAVLFGLVHVPVYGWSVLPLDIAAGAVLGWQRWATGSVMAAAVTHLVANLVVFL